MERSNQRKQLSFPISYRHSLFIKMMVSFMFISVLPILLCGVLMIAIFQAKAFNAYRTNIRHESEQIQASYEEMEQGIRHALQQLSNHKTLQSYFENEQFQAEQIYDLLYSMTNQYRNLADFTILNTDGISLFYTEKHMYNPIYWGTLKAARRDRNVVHVSLDTIGENKILRFAKAIVHNNKIVGYVCADLHNHHFNTLFANIISNNEGICLFDEETEVIFVNHFLENTSFFKELRHSWLSQDSYPKSLQNYHVYLQHMEKSNFSFCIVTTKVFSYQMMQTMYLTVALLGLISFGICYITALKSSKSFIQPINEMNRAMFQVQKGQLHTSIPITRQDEFGILSQNFNVMTEELSNFMNQKMETQKRMTDIEIAMMQSQLNPHFLYNTLDAIKWMAKSVQVEPISILSQKLARILRTAIVKEQFITIEEEYSICRDYGEIQNIRFEGKFNFVFICEAEILKYKIPKLIIQPLVENAFMHGFRNQNCGRIEVQARRREDYIILSVEDNGRGIDDVMIECINHHQWNKIDGHIGLYNVDSILRLHYGVYSGLRVKRLCTSGTKFEIILPYKEM